jgi:hypothetical protein
MGAAKAAPRGMRLITYSALLVQTAVQKLLSVAMVARQPVGLV